MGETVQKVQSRHGLGRFELCSPLAPAAAAASAAASSAPVGRHLRRGAAVVMVGGALTLCAAVAALCLWKASDTHVYNVRYGADVGGEVREGSVEIDSDNNLERFETASGAGEALEIHDFQIGITGIRFFGGDKCYVKSHIKAPLPHVGAENKETLMYDQADDSVPVGYDQGSPLWVASERPLTDTSFLSPKILDLCGELPVYWLRPAHPKDGERRKRDTERAKRQLSAEEREQGSRAEEDDDTSRVAVGEEEEEAEKKEEKEEEGEESGSAYNPENPYHRGGATGDAAASAATFDSMLDHLGICCADCRRGYTHCQRICEPLRGYWPWPYHHRGCRVACRVIMPCRWWVARIMGLV